MSKRLTKEQFIEKAKLIFPEYDYSKFEYINYRTKGEIICKKHGSFFKTPERLFKKQKCNKCRLEEKLNSISNLNICSNYREEYVKLIRNARKNIPNDNYEIHHILPKSMFPLWKNRKSNLVKLSYQDHYKAHYLLYKIYNNYEMTAALFLMLKESNLSIYKEVKEKQKKKHYKAIYCIEDDKIYDSIAEASKVYKISVYHALDSFSSTAASKHFCYLVDKEKAIQFLQQYTPKNKRGVFCLEQNRVYSSIAEATKENNLSPTKLIKSCRSFRKTCGKKHWCYLEEKEKAIQFWKENGTKQVEIKKQVFCLEQNKVYSSVAEATKENNLKSPESIASICRNQYYQRTAKKLHFCYLEKKEDALKYWDKKSLTKNLK